MTNEKTIWRDLEETMIHKTAHDANNDSHWLGIKYSVATANIPVYFIQGGRVKFSFTVNLFSTRVYFC